MAGLLYYVPGGTREISAEDLAAAGLSYVFDAELIAKGLSRNEIHANGPDGGAGVLVADSRHVRPRFEPEAQRWRQIPGGKAWVGLFADDPPQPEELVRQEPLDGHWVRLGDGRQWLIPVARAVTTEGQELVYYSPLPGRAEVDANGQWSAGGPLPEYERLWEVAQRWWDATQQALAEAGADKSTGAQEPVRITFDFQEINDAALTALAANYPVGKGEVGLLGLFNGQCVRSILDALVDCPTIVEWIKKNGQPLADVPPLGSGAPRELPAHPGRSVGPGGGAG